MRVQVENLNFAYKLPDLVLKNINMDALPGEVTALIGPNASGKTTLLRCIAGKLMSHGNISPVSYLPQEISSNAEMSVFEAVLLGRLQSLPWRVDEETVAIVQKILQNLEIEELDEPIHNLDIYHQLEILDLIGRVTREKKIVTIIVVHELNMAARYADRVVVLRNGEVYASGKPAAVLTEEIIRAVYKVDCTIRTDDGILQIIPHSAHK